MADTPRPRRTKKAPDPTPADTAAPKIDAPKIDVPKIDVLPPDDADAAAPKRTRKMPGSPHPKVRAAAKPRTVVKAKASETTRESADGEAETDADVEVEPVEDEVAEVGAEDTEWRADERARDALGGGDDTEVVADDADATVPKSRALATARPTSLAQADLLQRYMAEVTRYPLLSREDETATARQFIATQDPALARRLVTANLRLVVKIAWEYRRAAFNLLDLIQEGNVGLMQGVKKFDPERGVKLSTYAAWWIRAYIIRYLMDNWRLVKLGTTTAQRKIFFNLRKEKEKLAKEGFEPEAKLLAQRMNVTEQEVVEMDRRLGSDEFSLDQPIGDESRETYADRVTQGGTAIDDRLAEEQIATRFHEQLALFARTLEPGSKEHYLFEHRLTADDPQTLQQVGDHFGISRERARQIEARLTKRLKDYMREHLPDFEALSLTPPEE